MVEVEILYAGLCGSDINNMINNPTKPKISYGHEIVGKVKNIKNSKVKELKKGDYVIVNPFICSNKKKSDENEKYSLIYSPRYQAIGRELKGGFSKYLFIPKENLYKIGFEKKYLPVGVLADGIAVIFHAIHMIGEKKKKNCLIIGTGTIACLFALLFNDLFPETKITIVSNTKEKKKKLAKIFHKNFFIKLKTYNELSKEEKYDLIIETVGGQQIKTLNAAIKYSEYNATIAVIGAFSKNITNALRYRELFYKQLHMLGVNSYCNTYNDFLNAIKWINKNYVTLFSLITNIYDFSDIDFVIDNIINHKLKNYIKIIFKK